MIKVDIHAAPPPLEIKVKAGSFKLQLKRYTDAELAALLDACRKDSFEEITWAIHRLILTWEGVCDLIGNPIPFETVDGDKRQSRLGAFLGAAGLPAYLATVGAVCAFCGLPTADIEAMLARLEGGVKLDPTATQGGDGPKPASNG